MRLNSAKATTFTLPPSPLSAAAFWQCLLNDEASTTLLTEYHAHSSTSNTQVCVMTDPDRGDADSEDDVTASQVAAVCLIQRVYRGYRTRRELQGRHLTATNRWISV
ncbi:hypothetical protein BDW71DRAFT_149971 [Aspergillus fruticulosus]